VAKTKKIKKSKFRIAFEIFKEWKEVIAIIIGVASIIYTITVYKVNLESTIDKKISESEARTLIQMEVSDMKQDIRDIRNFLMDK
jgi:glucose uptake protein GlcU